MEYKVGLFSDSFPPIIDGVSNVVENYAHQLHKKHGNVVVAAPYYKDARDDLYPFDVVRYQSIQLRDRLAYRAGNPYDLKSLKRLEKQNMDLIHVHSPFSASILAKMLLIGKKKIPIIFTYHTKFNIEFEERIDVPVFRKIATDFVIANIKSSDEVWVVSKGAGESLKEIGYDGAYRVIENGTDFPSGRAAPDAVASLRRQYGVAEEEVVFLFVGRMMWYKNCRLTLDALRLLKEQDLSFRMFMVGDGFEKPEIEAYAAEIGLADRIIFTGTIQDREILRVYYSMADLFLFPSTFDTSGLVVKEAAACGCPSLLLEGSCAAETVEDSFSGFIAKEETATCCADRIFCAVSNRDRLKKAGENAGQHVYLSWADAIDCACRRYEEILCEWRSKTTKRFFLNRK